MAEAELRPHTADVQAGGRAVHDVDVDDDGDDEGLKTV